MSSENPGPDELTEERAKAISESIQSLSIQEVRALGEGLFPYVDSGWRQKFFDFVEENSAAQFYHATTRDQVHFVYCRDKDRGMWFIPGSGLGPLQEKGRRIFQEIVDELK